jgi:hypothetical protein
MFYRILLSVSACLICGVAGAADSWRVFTRAESFSYSGGSPVTAYIDFLIGPAPDDGNVAFSRNSVEMGVGFKRLEFSLIHRNDYNLYFSPDAAQFAYLTKNRKTIPLRQRYEVDVLANQYQVSGAKLGFSLPLWKNVDLNLAYSHLYATEAVSGYLGADPNGEGGHIAIDEIQDGNRTVKVLIGDLHTDYYYTHDPLFRSEVRGPTGQGYAFDMGITWRISPTLHLEARVDDLAGQIRWDNMPHIVADATSENFVEQEDGSFNVVPNFSGFDTLDDFNQDLTRRQTFKLTYKPSRYSFGYRYDRMSRTQFNRLYVGYHQSDRWGALLAVEVDTAAVELRLATPVGEMFFVVDDLNFDYAHTLGFGWNLNFRF